VIRVALRGLAGRKLRAFLTALAIVLGVAMVSGTFVLTDMIDRAFNDIFTQSYANTDAYVSGKSPGFNFEGDQVTAPSVPANLLPTVRKLPDVQAAAGTVADESATKIIDRKGKPITTGGAPTFGFGIDGSQRGRHRQRDRRRPELQGWRDGQGRDAEAGSAVQARRNRPVRQRRVDRERDLRHVHDSRRAGAPRPQGPARRDLGLGEAGCFPGAARFADQTGRPAEQGRRAHQGAAG